MSDFPVDFDDEDAYDEDWRPKRASTAGPAFLGEEAGEVSVRPYRTGQPFNKAALQAGLRRGKLRGTAPFGLIQVLSNEEDDDVRVVLARQGEVRIRRYAPDSEEVEYWTLPQALTDTVAIRYSGDPTTGFLCFTMFGGGKIPDALIDWFQSEFAGISRGTPIADALEPAHVRHRCFETDFLNRLYSIQAQLDAEGYETIDHTRFKSRKYIDPECKRLKEFQAAESLFIEAFESEVEVPTDDLQKAARIRFTVRTESGNIRLIIPKLQYKPTIRDVSAHTRAFYGLCERAFAEIVGANAPMSAHLDPGSDRDTLFAAVCDIRTHRAYLSGPGNRARFLSELNQALPKGFWLPHLRALDDILATGAVSDLDKLLDRLAADDPEQAIMLLSTTQAQRLHRLGSGVRDAVLRRLPTLPRALWPFADEVLLGWAVDDDDASWAYDPGTDIVTLYGVPYSVSRLSPAIRAKALLRCARDEHRRVLAAAPDPSGAPIIQAALARLAAFEPQDKDPSAAHHVRALPRRGGNLLRDLLGNQPLDGEDPASVVLHLHGLPLWPLIELSTVEGRRVLINSGLSGAAAVRLGDYAIGDIAPGAAVNVTEDAASEHAITFHCFGLEWRRAVAPAPAATTTTANLPTILVARKKLSEFRELADPMRKVLGQSEAMWRAIEEAYFADRQQPRPHILIEGATGTGKTELARMLHRAAGLHEDRFVRVSGSTFANVGDEHAQRGAILGYAPDHGFDGIDRKGKSGLLQHTAGGTLFVDDFEVLPARVQHTFLDVLTGEPLWMEGGVGKHAVKANCRVMLATNAGAEALKAAGVVRTDLLARVGARVALPPLCERIADAFEIVRTVLAGSPTLTARAWWLILNHTWPENVRELLKAINDAVVVARETNASEIDALHLRHLPAELRRTALDLPETHAQRLVLLAAERLARDEGYEHAVRGKGLQRRIGALLGLNETTVSRLYDQHVRGKKPGRQAS